MIQNVAQFKRALAVGVQIHAIHHRTMEGRDPETGKPIYGDSDMGIRPVSIVQSNSFAMATTRTTGEVVDSYCDYPKASMAQVENGAITIMERDTSGVEGYIDYDSPEYAALPLIPILTYRIV